MSVPHGNQVPKRHRDPVGQRLAAALTAYDANIRPLPGIQDPACLDCLVRQLLDSIRRVEFVKQLTARRHDPAVADPDSTRFDPLKAAVLRSNQGNADDAVWLVFLAVHFGKHAQDGWELARHVYGRVGEAGLWDWQSVSTDIAGFRRWLAAQNAVLRPFRFSNHRKYEGLDANSRNGTGSIVESFVNWILSAGSLGGLVREAHRRVGQNPAEVFDALYKDMRQVHRFGRLAKFDFLTLLGKLGVAPISPGSAYIRDNATGPYLGICLLVTGNRVGRVTRTQADAIYVELGQALNIGMQELEDALCNWQKSPADYRYFRG
jgi:hypothetical protein